MLSCFKITLPEAKKIADIDKSLAVIYLIHKCLIGCGCLLSQFTKELDDKSRFSLPILAQAKTMNFNEHHFSWMRLNSTT